MNSGRKLHFFQGLHDQSLRMTVWLNHLLVGSISHRECLGLGVFYDPYICLVNLCFPNQQDTGVGFKHVFVLTLPGVMIQSSIFFQRVKTSG